MTFILIWIILSGGHAAPATGSAVFKSKAACDMAAHEIRDFKPFIGSAVFVECFEND